MLRDGGLYYTQVYDTYCNCNFGALGESEHASRPVRISSNRRAASKCVLSASQPVFVVMVEIYYPANFLQHFIARQAVDSTACTLTVVRP